jgi:hypothetical protein
MIQYIAAKPPITEYNIMLYITDGEITDMEDTKAA